MSSKFLLEQSYTASLGGLTQCYNTYSHGWGGDTNTGTDAVKEASEEATGRVGAEQSRPDDSR